MKKIKKLHIEPSSIKFTSSYRYNHFDSVKSIYDSSYSLKHKIIFFNSTYHIPKNIKTTDSSCSSSMIKKEHKLINSLNNSIYYKLPKIQQSPNNYIISSSVKKRVNNNHVKRKIIINQELSNLTVSNKIAKVILSPLSQDKNKYNFSNYIPSIKTIYYSAMSRPGITKGGVIKENQDSYLAISPFENCYLFGIFDGHGRNGYIISGTIKNLFEKQFQQRELFEQIEKKIKHADTCDIIKKIFYTVEMELNSMGLEMNCSGSTCNLIIVVNEYIICANTGDSRSILVCEDEIIQLSRDHKPDLPDEKLRIEAMNGRIERISNAFHGPFRVWLKNEKYPGLALSRSFGDIIAKSIGVISEPGKFHIY